MWQSYDWDVSNTLRQRCNPAPPLPSLFLSLSLSLSLSLPPQIYIIRQNPMSQSEEGVGRIGEPKKHMLKTGGPEGESESGGRGRHLECPGLVTAHELLLPIAVLLLLKFMLPPLKGEHSLHV